MKKTLLILIFLVTIIILLNAGSFFGSIRGIEAYTKYEQGDFTGTLDRLNQAGKYLTGDTISYDRGNTLYKLGKWSEARREYERIAFGSGELAFRTFHNLGNTYYRLSEQSGTGDLVPLLTESVRNYDRALAIHEDDETRANREFVAKKLEQKKQESEQNKDENKSGSWSENKQPQSNSGSETGSGKTGSGQQDQKNEPKSGSGQQETGKSGQSWTNQGTYNPTGSSTNASSKPLSPEERKSVDEYTKNLREFQKQNGKFLNLDPNTTHSNSPTNLFEQFFGNGQNFDQNPSNGGRDW